MSRRTASKTAAGVKAAAIAAPIDHSILGTLLCNDDAAVRAVLSQFLASSAEDAAALCAALGVGNRTGALRLAHRLKGGGRMVGAGRLADICERAERAVREGDSPSVLATAAELEGEAKRLTAYLREWLAADG
jgi:HPt (histidine-containing phosphotransfer) domain-containing protein